MKFNKGRKNIHFDIILFLFFYDEIIRKRNNNKDKNKDDSEKVVKEAGKIHDNDRY